MSSPSTGSPTSLSPVPDAGEMLRRPRDDRWLFPLLLAGKRFEPVVGIVAVHILDLHLDDAAVVGLQHGHPNVVPLERFPRLRDMAEPFVDQPGDRRIVV